MAINPFAPPPDRDAYATIRGFVYQVDLTILRWLDLPAGSALELEAGEDIDQVAAALGAQAFSLERVLEQVKHRDKALTLRNKSALEAVTNALEHRATNQGHTLHIRFSTNTRPGQEEPIEAGKPLPMPMITLWEKLHRGEDLGFPLSDGFSS
jgi:hypothetical protein